MNADVRVGIWRAQTDGNGQTSFVRAADAAGEWSFWANVHRIGPKRGQRVVLLGESAARGFLYDPQLNVAKALQAMLDHAAGARKVEVVDLARLRLGPSDLLALISAAPALDPDLVIVYAGDNWRSGSATTLGQLRRGTRADALSTGGLVALQRQCESDLADDVRAMLRLLAMTWPQGRVPVVVVVPEVNLADWKDVDVMPGWLGRGRTATWWAIHEQLRQAQRAGAQQAGAELVARLLELDEGTCAHSQLLWAEELRRQGRPTSERYRTLAAARDAALWSPRMIPSRTFSIMQETLRDGCARLGLHVVDLPRELPRQFGVDLPDRRLFLDNAHLSYDGIRFVAAATAAVFTPLLGMGAPPAAELLRATMPLIGGALEASVHFASAIINAEWGQNDDVVRFHGQRAFARDPTIADTVENYLELSARAAPPWLCGALGRLAAQPERLGVLNLVLGHMGRRPQLMQPELSDALHGLLDGDVLQRLDDLRCAEHGRHPARTALHRPYFALRSLGERGADRPTAGWSDALHAYAPESRFWLIRDEPRDVRLKLCARLDRGQPEGTLALAVNGDEALRATIGPSWQTWETTVPAASLRRGRNEVTIRWPMTLSDDAWLDRAAEQLRHGLTPQLWPLFGEIHSFWATDACV